MLTRIINRIGDLGVKPDYEQWEKYLARKLNIYSIICIATLALALTAYTVIGDYRYVGIFTWMLIAFPLVFVANIRLNYLYALYVFYFLSTAGIEAFTIRMGAESLIFLFFYPLIISLITLLNRKEKNIHIIILLSMAGLLILANIIGITLGQLHSSLNDKELEQVRIINISFSSFITILFSIVLSRQNALQQAELASSLKEKDILLAEVHHRVKNNMAIISSLLNLKKESVASDEMKQVLEDFRNRIFSMALIHRNIYGSDSLKSLDLKQYITELAEELISAYSDKNEINLAIECPKIDLPIDTIMPCGIIINELVTNSLKYAISPNKILDIRINIEVAHNNLRFVYTDNGPGFPQEQLTHSSSLGTTLIDMLCQQLDAIFSFKTDNGFKFEMSFVLNTVVK